MRHYLRKNSACWHALGELTGNADEYWPWGPSPPSVLQRKTGLHHRLVARRVGVRQQADHSAALRGHSTVSLDQQSCGVNCDHAMAAQGLRTNGEGGGTTSWSRRSLDTAWTLLCHSDNADSLDLVHQHRVVGLLGENLDFFDRH